MNIKINAIISGKVQGVWFRANTKKKADELEISGWVKNTEDGNVEAVFEGDEKNVYKLIRWCSKGPANSKVTKIDIIKKKYTKEFNNFSIIY